MLRGPRYVALVVVSVICVAGSCRHAQAGGFFRAGAVGGISINAEGIVAQPSVEARIALHEWMMENIKGAPPELTEAAEMRKISLRGLESAVADALRNNAGILPEDVKYLGGIQRIEYVFVCPDQNDIILAGPGEGWEVDDHGNVVGVSTRRPVIHIDDLVVALRSAKAARDVGITCSIDPTPEGRQALDELLRKQKQFHPGITQRIEKAMGPQQVTITGIPTNTHAARVLAACDYRMKRIAMNLEQSPVKGLPGFLDLLKSSPRKPKTMTPRWWLACNYEPLARSEDGLAWQLRGQGVKALSEDDFVAADGTVRRTNKSDPLAQRWADLMTERYDDLSTSDVVFGQLRNLMDMCVVAALIEEKQLLARAHCNVPLLLDPSSNLMTEDWFAAKTVATQCSFVKKNRDYIITASGGVEIASWNVIRNVKNDAEVGKIRQQAVALAGNHWCWD